MSKIEFIGILAIFSFTGILFTPRYANWWMYPLIFGLVFGGVWFWKS